MLEARVLAPAAQASVPAHRLPVRVYYEDTDAGGVVYHATYLRYAERARAEFLRDLGYPNARLHAEWGLAFAVRRCELDFRAPARLDELLSVDSDVLEIGGASLAMRQTVTRDDVVLVGLTVRLVAVGPDFRPLRLPHELRATMIGAAALAPGGSAGRSSLNSASLKE
jgi:acyl-CoA thioester hydrolase